MAEDRMYLTVDKDPHGRGLIAIITQGHIQRGDKNCTVLTLEVGFKNMKAAKTWYKQMKIERPWETRN